MCGVIRDLNLVYVQCSTKVEQTSLSQVEYWPIATVHERHMEGGYSKMPHIRTLINQIRRLNLTRDLCHHTQFFCAHVALSNHYLFVNYVIGTLAERLNERASTSLTC